MRRSALLLAWALALPALAGGWAKEPDRVFGLQLGSRFDDLSVIHCDLVRPDDAERALKFCKWMSAPDATFVRGLPVAEFADGIVMTVDGEVSAFILNGKHEDYARIRAILVERYGPPTRRSVVKVRTKRGVPYDSETLSWTGKRVTLDLEEYSHDIDSSAATFHYLPLLKKSTTKSEADAKAKATKM